MDYIKKFLYKDDISIIIVRIEDTIKATQKAHDISYEDALIIGRAQSLASFFTIWEKDDKASVSVSLKYPEIGKNYTAISEKDGRVRGCVSGYNKGVIKTGVILEITQKLQIKGDYTGVVTADTEEDAVHSYFENSSQIVATCKIKEVDEICYCLVIEHIPGHHLQEQKATIADAEEFLKDFIKLWDDKLIKVTEDFKQLENIDIKYGCTCTRYSVSKMISALAPEEMGDYSNGGKISVTCKLCGKKYEIDL